MLEKALEMGTCHTTVGEHCRNEYLTRKCWGKHIKWVPDTLLLRKAA